MVTVKRKQSCLTVIQFSKILLNETNEMEIQKTTLSEEFEKVSKRLNEQNTIEHVVSSK